MAEHPTLRQLDILLAVLEHGGFRDAARALGVSQVAVSDHIRQLESKLGLLLFDREKGGRATPNAVALSIRNDAAALISAADALVAKAHAVNQAAPASPDEVEEQSGFVADISPVKSNAPAPAKLVSSPPVAAAPSEPTAAPTPIPAPVEKSRPTVVRLSIHSAMLGLFQPGLEQFEADFPDHAVALDLDCYTADQVMLAFAEGRTDVACYYALGGSRLLLSNHLWIERLSLFVAADHALAQRDSITASDLNAAPVIAFNPQHPMRPIIDVIARAAGLNMDKVDTESDDFASLRASVLAGQGVLPLFGGLASHFATLPGIKRLPFIDPLPHVDVRRAVRPGANSDPAFLALSQLLVPGTD